jgi:ABC-type transporter Mla subunit MlaD
MPLQDLTPQLRTRLSRVERAVGIFVLLATALLLAGFVYYVWHTAERKGWFVTKVPFYTYADTAIGLKVGDPVKLMGFDVGEITKIEAMPPYAEVEVIIEFIVKDPYYGYLWTEGSFARVTAADFLGKRTIEVTKGTNGLPIYLFGEKTELPIAEAQALPKDNSYLFAEDVFDLEKKRVARTGKPLKPEVLKQLAALRKGSIQVFHQHAQRKTPDFVWQDQQDQYVPFYRTNMYFLPPRESPALTERLEQVVDQVQAALPGIMHLTNHLAAVLTNATRLVNDSDQLVLNAKPLLTEANDLIFSVRPTITNLNLITKNLSNPTGSLGEWILPLDLRQQIQGTLASATNTLNAATGTLTNADAGLLVTISNLNRSLDSLAGITSNLNAQVQANTNLVKEISDAIVHADDMIQGLKRHWLLRSAFKTNAPPKALAPKSGSKK